MKIILASDSKKDKELLDLTVMEYELLEHKSGYPKNPRSKDFEKYVQNMAKKRTNEVIKKYSLKEGRVVGVYTLVIQGKKVIPRPESEAEVVKVLTALSGKAHTVMTGICVVDTATKKAVTDISKTKVKFFKLDPQEIINYSKIDEWEASPAGYYIHGAAGIFIDTINGDYYNTMGLPLSKIKQLLKD